jgi:hypothetical protein
MVETRNITLNLPLILNCSKMFTGNTELWLQLMHYNEFCFEYFTPEICLQKIETIFQS